MTPPRSDRYRLSVLVHAISFEYYDTCRRNMAENRIQPVEGVSAENILEIRKLKRGDHIAAEGEFAETIGVRYFHHGIFLGHEKGVADFGGSTMENAQVRIVDILGFTDRGRKRLIRVVYPPEMCLTPDETIERAEKVTSNPDRWKAFDLVTNNCEHFATYCKIGRAFSGQVATKVKEALSALEEVVQTAVASSYQGSASLGLRQ